MGLYYRMLSYVAAQSLSYSAFRPAEPDRENHFIFRVFFMDWCIRVLVLIVTFPENRDMPRIPCSSSVFAVCIPC